MKPQHRKAIKTRKQHQMVASVKKWVYIVLAISATYIAGTLDFHNTLIQGYKSIETYAQNAPQGECLNSICSVIKYTYADGREEIK